MPLMNALNKLPRDASCYWVALSGGVDSMVLLHALVGAELGVPIKAIHVHHGLSVYADQWQQLCESVCQELGVALKTVHVHVKTAGKGLEDAARQARYDAFAELVGLGDILLTAHHGDDQVETMLLRLMRGAGPRGLASMAASRPLGRGLLMRPLLGMERRELERYAQTHHVRWAEDDSNVDRRFDRNYLRHEVMPAMRQRWPGLVAAWSESAVLCSESEALLGDLAAEDLERAVLSEPGSRPKIGPVLDVQVLSQWSFARRCNVLRYWIRAQGLPVPGREQLFQVNQQFIDGREDAQARVIGGDWELRRFRRGLYLLRPHWLRALPEPLATLNWNPDAEPQLALPDGGRLSAQRLIGNSAEDEAMLLRTDLPELRVCWRQGGERCQPGDRGHSQSLKNLLQEYDLEPWWRGKLPLIYSGDTLVAAGDLWVCRGFEAPPGTSGYQLGWRPAGSF